MGPQSNQCVLSQPCFIHSNTTAANHKMRYLAESYTYMYITYRHTLAPNISINISIKQYVVYVCHLVEYEDQSFPEVLHHVAVESGGEMEGGVTDIRDEQNHIRDL